jgi:hypothetical protein
VGISLDLDMILETEGGLTRKFPAMRDADQERPSVQRLIPLSSTLKTKTAPLRTIVARSSSFNLRVMRGMTP